jgi:hypothetical protein
LKNITFQSALRKATSSFARIRNPLQVTADVSLFWWFISAIFGVRNGTPVFYFKIICGASKTMILRSALNLRIPAARRGECPQLYNKFAPEIAGRGRVALKSRKLLRAE